MNKISKSLTVFLLAQLMVDALPICLWWAGLKHKANLLWGEVEAAQFPPDALFIDQTLHHTVCLTTTFKIFVICKAEQNLTHTLFRQIL
jgi:hypothetical protein